MEQGGKMKVSILIDQLKKLQDKYGDKIILLVNNDPESDEGSVYLYFETLMGGLNADLMDLSDEIEIYIREE